MPYELIVVEASEDEETKKYISSLNCNFKCSHIKQQKGGTAKARNLGMEKCNGDIVLFLDDDVILDRKYTEEISKTYAADPEGKLGGVTGVVIKEKPSNIKRLKYSLSRFFKTIFLWDSLKNDGKILPTGMLPRLPETIAYVQAFYGHNMSFRRVVANKHRFDENLEIYSWALGEDIDFSYQIGKKYFLMVNPKAKLEHKLTSEKDYKFTDQFYFHSSTMLVRNFYYIMSKNMGNSLKNKLAFSWAITGLLLGRTFSFLLHPTKRRQMALKGVIRGLKLILKF